VMASYPQGDAHGLTDVKGRYKPLNAAKQFRSDWYVPRDLSLSCAPNRLRSL
jgi:hypothetical protein